MITKTLYRYVSGNKIITSLTKPDVEYTEKYRLVADENKVLTKDDVNFYRVIDINTEELPQWKEIDKPENYGLRK
jgi:hypothetical protein